MLYIIKLIGTAIGYSLYYLLPKRRKIVQDNLSQAFAEKTKEEIYILSKKNFIHYGTILSELIFFRRRRDIRNLIQIENPDIFLKALQENKGVILMSAHLGNWEVGLQKFKLEFSPFYVVAREIKSRWAASIMKKLRTRYGVEIIQAKNSYRTIVDLLKQNKVVGFAFDQHHGHRGIYVDFFGRAAATSPGIAMLARETGACVIPSFNFRNLDGSFTGYFDEPLPFVKTNNKEFDLFYNTQIYTKKIEEWVRKYPEQWFWLHRRWKGDVPKTQAIQPIIPFREISYQEFLNYHA